MAKWARAGNSGPRLYLQYLNTLACGHTKRPFKWQPQSTCGQWAPRLSNLLQSTQLGWAWKQHPVDRKARAGAHTFTSPCFLVIRQCEQQPRASAAVHPPPWQRVQTLSYRETFLPSLVKYFVTAMKRLPHRVLWSLNISPQIKQFCFILWSNS